MDLEKARAVSASASTASRAHLALALDFALRERDRLEAQADDAARLRALPDPQWRSAPRLPRWSDGSGDAA